MINISPNTERTRELLADTRDLEKEAEEEYNNLPRWEKELGEMLFDIYRGHFLSKVATYGAWNSFPPINKNIWIRTAVDAIRVFAEVR
jgi:hypothetical protein